MKNIDEMILQDYRLLVERLDVMKKDLTDQEKANTKLQKAFLELLEVYQGELDRRGSVDMRNDIEYDWCEKAGILD